MVAIEAMMHGVSVIAAPRGALPVLLNQGERGWLAKQGSVNGLVFALSDWLSTYAFDKKQINEAAQAYVLQYCSGEKQWEDYRLIYGLA